MKPLAVILLLAGAGALAWILWRERGSLVTTAAGSSPASVSRSTPLVTGSTVNNEDSSGDAIAALAAAVAGKRGVGNVVYQTGEASLTIQGQDEAAKRAAVEREFFRVNAAPNGAAIAATWGDADGLWAALTENAFPGLAPVLLEQIRKRVGL